MPEGPTPSEAEDARLVREAREGDAEAFERLVRRHLGVAHRVALSKTGSAHDADDVCQDAFVKALERLEDCRRPERFRAWLLAIVRNTALNAVERERRRRTEPLAAAGSLHAGGGDPDWDLERRTLRDALQAAIDRLPEMQRKVLLMHDYEGWTHVEIGGELEIAAGTSRYHLHEARKAMRVALGSRGEDDGPGVPGSDRGESGDSARESNR